MAGNESLNLAKAKPEDEFYTQISDIEKELVHYKKYFKGKIIFCNCDDPLYSNFWKYFQLNFYELGLKKLISTHYEEEKPSYKMEIIAGDNKQQIGIPNYIKTPLKQNGDFRSPESINILDEADIVVTNPPFSLFRDYLPLLIEHNKKFIILANQNNLTYKEVFPLIKENKIWLGYYSGDMEFRVPDNYKPRKTRFWIDENGNKWRSFGNICWLTNLDIEKRHEELILFRNYNPLDYPRYDNYNAIEVSRIADIPCDYYDVMGVPITFMKQYNPSQFTILGCDESEGKGFSNGLWNSSSGIAQAVVNGIKKYKRVFIIRKQE